MQKKRYAKWLVKTFSCDYISIQETTIPSYNDQQVIVSTIQPQRKTISELVCIWINLTFLWQTLWGSSKGYISFTKEKVLMLWITFNHKYATTFYIWNAKLGIICDMTLLISFSAFRKDRCKTSHFKREKPGLFHAVYNTLVLWKGSLKIPTHVSFVCLFWKWWLTVTTFKLFGKP